MPELHPQTSCQVNMSTVSPNNCRQLLILCTIDDSHIFFRHRPGRAFSAKSFLADSFLDSARVSVHWTLRESKILSAIWPTAEVFGTKKAVVRFSHMNLLATDSIFSKNRMPLQESSYRSVSIVQETTQLFVHRPLLNDAPPEDRDCTVFFFYASLSSLKKSA